MVRVGVEVEQLGGVGKDRVPFRHRAILGSFRIPLAALGGVWRSPGGALPFESEGLTVQI